MIETKTFNLRRDICKQCSWWNGVCLKGHALQGSAGCPVQKFPPVNAADYAPDRYVELPKVVPVLPCCGEVPAVLKPMTYVEAMGHLKQSLVAWKAAGYPRCEGDEYVRRTQLCKNCPSGFYAWFQCSQCKCVIYTKAALTTEHCPAGHW
jgi:hypothetical protein